jgi:hypothetical protein
VGNLQLLLVSCLVVATSGNTQSGSLCRTATLIHPSVIHSHARQHCLLHSVTLAGQREHACC